MIGGRSASIGSRASSFAPRTLPAADAATFVRESLRQVPTTYTVEVLIAADADAVRDRVGPWATVESARDDRCLMRMRTDSFDWPAMVLGNVGAEFTVLNPPELTDYLAELSRRFSRAATG
jgi:predicted DNA-binding transcriptional regulator YafY